MTKLRIAMRSFTDFEAALSAQLAAYEVVNPLVEVEVVPLTLHALEVAVLGSGGLRDGGCDLAIFPTDWIGSAVETKALDPLEEWMRAAPLPGWPDGWPSSLREPLRQRGNFDCIPWHDGPECLIYRKDLFDNAQERETFFAQCGRELQLPVTWEEFLEIARFFTRPVPRLYGTLFAAYPDGHNTLYDLILQVWSRDGELYDSEGNPSMAGPEVVEALDFYRGIIRDPTACYAGAADVDSIRSGDIFLSGEIAMMVNWFGFAARANRADSPLRGKIGLAPIPGGRHGQSASLSNYWVIGIGAGGAEKQTAYQLLRHIASPAMDKLTTLHGAVGVRLSTWNDAEVLEQVPLYSELERLSAVARTLPFCKDLPKLAEIVNRVTIEALNTDEPSASILERAQRSATEQRLKLR